MIDSQTGDDLLVVVYVCTPTTRFLRRWIRLSALGAVKDGCNAHRNLLFPFGNEICMRNALVKGSTGRFTHEPDLELQQRNDATAATNIDRSWPHDPQRSEAAPKASMSSEVPQIEPSFVSLTRGSFERRPCWKR
jgi:hypothetical protein